MTKPIPLSALQSKLCDIWGTKPNTTKLMLQRVEDWTDESFQEDCYVDIRAKGTCNNSFHLISFLVKSILANPNISFTLVLIGTEERTRETVLDGMKKVQDAFGDHDLIANVRLETYEGARYFHVPPSK